MTWARAPGALILLCSCHRSDPPPPLPDLANQPAVTEQDLATRRRENGARIDGFLRLAGAYRDDPRKIAGTTAKCEPNGRCEVATTVADDWAVGAYYFKGKPKASRFSISLNVEVDCATFNAVVTKSWSRTSAIDGAAGSGCIFTAGPLEGFGVIIEMNEGVDRVPRPGIHIFSPSYLKLDTDFAHAVSVDESRAR